ncbi:MAG: iron transporter FeoA [Desulfobulbaceae bacterium]|nr:iron transporter FeoA [Desulfobulbaceae bacterium]
MKLRQMQAGQAGSIESVKVQGPLGMRLREMGLIPGAKLQVEGRAPLYDPVRIRLNGQSLTLRNREADYIEISGDQA